MTQKVSLIIIKSRLRLLEETEEIDNLNLTCKVGAQYLTILHHLIVMMVLEEILTN